MIAAAAVLAVAGVVRVAAGVPTDRGDSAVVATRIRAARVLTVAGVGGAVAWFGAPGLVALSPALIAAAAAAFPPPVGASPAT